MIGAIRKCGNVRGRLLSADGGVAAVEFALVAAPFIAVILAALQVLTLFLAQQILETVADTASRQILTGNAQQQGLTQAQFQTLICGEIPALLQCGGVMVDVEVASSFAVANVSAPTLTYNSNGSVSNTWQYNIGTQGQIVVMRLLYQWPVLNSILSLGNDTNSTHLLMATRVFRNETYN